MPPNLDSNSLLPLPMPWLGQTNDTHRTGPLLGPGGTRVWSLARPADIWLFVWMLVETRGHPESEGRLIKACIKRKKTWIHDTLFGTSWPQQKVEGPWAVTKERGQWPRQNELWCHRGRPRAVTEQPGVWWRSRWTWWTECSSCEG